MNRVGDESLWIESADAGSESRVQRTIQVQPRDGIDAGSIVTRELAADDNLAIRLQGHRPDPCVCTQSWIEGGVQRTIAVQAGDGMTVKTVERREIAADDDLSVRLERQRGNEIIRPAVIPQIRAISLKRRILIPIAQHPHDPVVRSGVIRYETAGNDGPAIGLFRDGIDRAAVARRGAGI